MSYVIFIQTTEILIKEEKKTTKKKFDIFLSIMNHVKIVLQKVSKISKNSAVEVILEPIQYSVKLSLVPKKLE